jgi:poly-gamma-glutamate system protein
LDPAESGLIGLDFSDLTSTLGDLGAKQTSLNPYFAALVVMWLKEAGVVPGDRLAISLSGSFPALNIAVLSAAQVMGLKPLIISSVGASSFGANIPGLTWPDMERFLFAQGLIPWRSQYASLGGIIETDGGLDGTGIEVAREAIAKHGAIYLQENGAVNLEEDLARRQKLYFAEGPPKAYLNVGGGITALGWTPEAALLGEGLLRRVPGGSSPKRGLIFKMYAAGIPVIHLLNIERLAARYHLPQRPTSLALDPQPLNAANNHAFHLGSLLLAWLLLGSLLTRLDQKKSAS